MKSKQVYIYNIQYFFSIAVHRVVFSINATCNAAFKLGQNKYVRFREAHFHHKFEKGNSDFYLTIQTFLIQGGKLRLSELYNSYTQLLILTRDCKKNVRIVKGKHRDRNKKLNCSEKSQNWKI